MRPAGGCPASVSWPAALASSTAEIEAAVADLASRHLVRELRDGQVYLASAAEYLTTFEPLPGLGSVIDPMGATITCTEQRIMQRPVPEEARRALRLAPGAQACTVQRSWTVGRCPAAVSTTYLPAYLASLLVPGRRLLPPEIGAILNPPSAYPDPLRGRGARPPGRALPGGAAAAPRDARRLRLRQGEPAITVTVMFEHPATGLPFALTAAVLHPALFRVAIETTPGYRAAGPSISLAPPDGRA